MEGEREREGKGKREGERETQLERYEPAAPLFKQPGGDTGLSIPFSR